MRMTQVRKIWVAIICACIGILYFITGWSPPSMIIKSIFKDPESAGFEEGSKLHFPWKNCSDLLHDWSKYNMSEEYFRLLPSFENR